MKTKDLLIIQNKSFKSVLCDICYLMIIFNYFTCKVINLTSGLYWVVCFLGVGNCFD